MTNIATIQLCRHVAQLHPQKCQLQEVLAGIVSAQEPE
jgi:hypothetical protein